MYEFWLYLHILLLVFWVGTDLGVFLAARYSERTELSYETRAIVLQLGMVLDRLPRSALAIIIPSGLNLAAAAGIMQPPGLLIPMAWLLGAVWLVILWRGFLSTEPKVQEQSAIINWILNMAMAPLVTGAGLYLLLATDTSPWLAWKVIAVGGIFIIGVLLDLFFKPAVGFFNALADNPEEPVLNSQYSRSLKPVYITVLMIYALALGAAALGVFKP